MQNKNTIPLKKTKRFICLCSECLVKTRFHKTAFKELAISMCGIPACIWLIISFMFMTIFSLFIWLTVVNLNIQNKSYFAKCYSNNDCDLSKGLQCSPQDGSCNCPAVNTKARCDCGKGNYWNGINCSLILDFNSTGCTHDYQCDQSKDLVCLNGSCICRPPKRWNSTNNKCDYTYLGCFWEGSNPSLSYYTGKLLPAYFVEFCIENCYKSDYKFASFQFLNNVTTCGCHSSLSFGSISTRCNLFCVGFTKAWSCGSSNSWNQRPLYRTD